MAELRHPEIRALRDAMASFAAPPDAPRPTWADRRAGVEAMAAATPLPEGVQVEPLKLGGVPAEKITPPVADATRTIFYLHGGGYCLGSSASHRGWGARLAVQAGATAYTVDYRLAPEHPFPAAVDDALAAWRGLLAEGCDASRTVFSGDSAGGGLAVACAVAARDAGVPLPAGLHVTSPWVNLANVGTGYKAKGETDFIITQAGIDEFAANYLAGGDPKAPLASPVLADLAGLPPTLIHVGSEEVLMSDATLLAEVAGFALVDVTLRIWPDMVHWWPFFGQLSVGGPATAEAGAWIKARVP